MCKVCGNSYGAAITAVNKQSLTKHKKMCEAVKRTSIADLHIVAKTNAVKIAELRIVSKDTVYSRA